MPRASESDRPPLAPPPFPVTPPAVGRALAAVAAVLTLAYLLPFRAYGIQVEDEGLLLYQIIRVLDGEVPYLDFMTGYTPGYFYVGAALRALAGDVPTYRVALALCQAVIVSGMVVLIAKVARPVFALTLPFLYLVFIPVYPGAFCTFNIPYPAWFATVGWVVTAVAMIAFVTGRRRVWLVLAGHASAFAFATKPNAGVFAIAAAAAIVLLVEDDGPRERGVLAPVLWWLLWVGILGGVVFTFGRPTAVDALVYFVPVAAVMLAIATPGRIGRPTVVGDLVALLGSFATVTLPWLAFFAIRLGPERFLREMFYIGSNAARVFYVPYPLIELWALVATAVVLAIAVTGAVARRHPRAAVAALLMAVAVTATASVVVLSAGVMPERFTWSVIWQLEHVAFTLTLGAQVAGVVWLVRERRRLRMAVGSPGTELEFAL